jgi:pyruvate/2-oxoglutarate dehydrogenase complex dihydrolipoamide acyltransferase (E2) component
MIYQLAVPGPIEDVEEVRVLEWHGAVGKAIAPGDLIVELETHKAVVEIRAGQPGVLRAILSEAGGWQQLGKPLALLSDAADEPLTAMPPEDCELLPVDFEIT